MKYLIGLLLGFFLFHFQGYTQVISWKPLTSMPEGVANHSLVVAKVEGKTFIYAFAGIDSSRIYSGIHLKSWRYDVANGVWEQLPDLPDTRGKIATGASVVNNKIYIIGGYYVFANGTEKSSGDVHVFNPVTNQFEADASAIPVPIDDQVQAVWRDSLIFVITGWSDNKNVQDVQIFNPTLNDWKFASPVPNTNDYKVFGASGTIIGDTIFYAGGAYFGPNFPLGTVFRKGIINPNDPTLINWSSISLNEAKGYRMGAFKYNQKAYWIGGSIVSYNFNGIAYNGTGPVAPLSRLMYFDSPTQNLVLEPFLPPEIMDLRGVAQIGTDSFLVAGGMKAGPVVTDSVFLLTFSDSSTTRIGSTINPIFNITQAGEKLEVKLPDSGTFTVQMLDLSGQSIHPQQTVRNSWTKDLSILAEGVYILHLRSALGEKSSKILVYR